MIGFGRAERSENRLSVLAEVRSVNNRYLRVTARCTETHASLEPQIEQLVRKRLKRGSVQVLVTIERELTPEECRLNIEVLNVYLKQLEPLLADSRIHLSLGHLLSLPGVLADSAGTRPDLHADWPIIERTVLEALDGMEQMRRQEGRHMADQLQQSCETIAEVLEQIESRAPAVIDTYRERLLDRVRIALESLDIEVNQADVMREVAIFADRADITEELVRLKSHVQQFRKELSAERSNGRKLEFISQEMFREANTIGAKAADPQITQGVLTIKGEIERLKEIVQNVE